VNPLYRGEQKLKRGNQNVDCVEFSTLSHTVLLDSTVCVCDVQTATSRVENLLRFCPVGLSLFVL